MLKFNKIYRLEDQLKRKDVIEFRLTKEMLVKRSAQTKIPTKHGVFNCIGYENIINKDVHVALSLGDIDDGDPVLARVHSQCLTGDVFGSQRCDCGDQLDYAMEKISEEGRGVVVYLAQEGRGIGLINKLKAYGLQDEGADTVQANKELGFKDDLRDYGMGAQILRDLGISKLRLLTNNPRKIVGLDGYGLEIYERVPIVCKPREGNIRYLNAKQNKLGHMLNIKKAQDL